MCNEQNTTGTWEGHCVDGELNGKEEVQMLEGPTITADRTNPNVAKSDNAVGLTQNDVSVRQTALTNSSLNQLGEIKAVSEWDYANGPEKAKAVSDNFNTVVREVEYLQILFMVF